MTYFDIVDKIRDTYEYADARHIFEHIAIQINVIGEGAGALYIEVAERSVCVEPYDYKDRDVLVTTDAKTIVDVCDGNITYEEALESGRLHREGNMEKLNLFKTIALCR